MDLYTTSNKHIIGEIIHNSNKVTLLELAIEVSYASDIDKVTPVLLAAVKSNQYVSDIKKPLVGIANFGDSSVDFEIRVWVDSSQHNSARFAVNKTLWDCLKENQIDIPFPQREIRMLQA